MAPQREWFEKDYYKALGVAANATDKEINRAYRSLAKKYHPDANRGDAAAEERFKEISAAYDVLGDAEKRKEYDQVREMVASGQFGPGGPGFGPGAGGAGGAGFGAGPGGFHFEGDLGDLLGNLFNAQRGARGRRGGPAGARGPQRGDDLETELHLDFGDAAHGVTTTVAFTAPATCSVCHGTGAKPGTVPERCPTCGGSGHVAVDQGPFSFSEVCPTCGGRGEIVKEPCPQCGGRGVEVRPREVKVRIPVGVNDGARIRVAGRGAAGAYGGPPGDLYVVVHVSPHRVFGRKGRKDLTVKVPVTFAEAALGTTVKVPTLDEPVSVKVKSGTASGTTVRVRGRGLHPPKGGAGDLYVTFDVVVPPKLSKEQREAVEALAGTFTDDPRAGLGVT